MKLAIFKTYELFHKLKGQIISLGYNETNYTSCRGFIVQDYEGEQYYVLTQKGLDAVNEEATKHIDFNKLTTALLQTKNKFFNEQDRALAIIKMLEK